MSKQYQIKQVETNERGHKVVTTVSTDDPEVAKSLIGTATTTSGKKTTKTTEEKKKNKESSKKGVVIEAEFTEVKAKNKEVKSKSSKKTVTKPKALPAPKVKEPKKEEKKKDSEHKLPKPKADLKIYSYAIQELGAGLIIYAPNKEGADKLINVYCMKTGQHAKFNKVVKKTTENKKLIDKHKLTIDNYYQVQLEALENGIKKNIKLEPKKIKPLKPLVKKETKSLLAPTTKKETKSKLSKKAVSGTATITHNSRNLDERQVSSSNHNSMSGTRGTTLKKDYEAYRKTIEFSGLSVSQKNKLLDKLYKLYEPILRYDSQYYSSMVSGPARYPAAKMEAIVNRRMEASQKFLEWWRNIEPQLASSQCLTKEAKAKQEAEAKEKKIKSIKEGFNLWYNILVSEVPEYQKKGRDLKYNSNAAMVQYYVTEALKVDTELYKELFEKLNKVCNFSKNSNFYKGYKLVQEGKISNDSIQKQKAEDNKVIFKCSDYVIKNLKIQAGKRIAIKFTFYPKPQLVWALKKRGYIWYSHEDCFICKPEKFDLEWGKGIQKQYEKYL
ncbi:MAG: hypothetical protein NC310_08025 [Roseburia sp.]|nr:hypothetical protein [Roseburia sp.]